MRTQVWKRACAHTHTLSPDFVITSIYGAIYAIEISQYKGGQMTWVWLPPLD
jgi:hypothetical protein